VTPAQPGPLDSLAAKRMFDIVIATGAAIVLAPVALLVAFGVRVTTGSPVLFRQERTGLRGRSFVIYKFRTMRDAGASDAERLTPFGRFLRGASLDELPQIWNVLRGDMSLVGPRPLLPEYLPLYSPRHARRHDVKPGVTGWSAVKGRNELSWKDQFEYDLWYIENRSFSLDLRIVWLTFGRVLTRKGVNQPGQATREHFPGT
jgi:lipopolysaccharide/colanic/teichoic acid biosynthesis glycosyltransferase